MISQLLKLSVQAALVYAGYKFYELSKPENIKLTHGRSSSAVHDAIDNAEEASMDSFPASDPPARNVFN